MNTINVEFFILTDIEYKDRYVEERDINLALSKHVIPQIIVEQCHDNLELSFFKNIKDNKICLEVADLKVAVYNTMQKGSPNSNQISRRGFTSQQVAL